MKTLEQVKERIAELQKQYTENKSLVTYHELSYTEDMRYQLTREDRIKEIEDIWKGHYRMLEWYYKK